MLTLGIKGRRIKQCKKTLGFFNYIYIYTSFEDQYCSVFQTSLSPTCRQPTSMSKDTSLRPLPTVNTLPAPPTQGGPQTPCPRTRPLRTAATVESLPAVLMNSRLHSQ